MSSVLIDVLLSVLTQQRTRVHLNRTQNVLQPLGLDSAPAPLPQPHSPPYSPFEHDEAIGLDSVNSFDTISSTSSSGSSFEKQISIRPRIREKRLFTGSPNSREQLPAPIENARVRRGLWQDQLLVDRSLRIMAVTMLAFALAMVLLVIKYAQQFRDRVNPGSTSVGGDTKSCKDVATTNTVILLLINVCATMVLGMSNTYQQIVTSLNVHDLKYVLSRFGDSRVGTNSPLSIRHKQFGRKRAWCAWLLLVTTSLPIHFLANSLIGPSYIQKLPQVVNLNPHDFLTEGGSLYRSYAADKAMSFPCWSALHTGTAHFPKSASILQADNGFFGATQQRFNTTWKRMEVLYSDQCAPFARRNTDLNILEAGFNFTQSYDASSRWYSEENCYNGWGVMCLLRDPEPIECRLNVRMSAAFILMSCLVIKAMYMCVVNLVARGQKKTQCLTFGDVIVASASHPELQVKGECLVNARDNCRTSTAHTCHKHCNNPERSTTGDEIGHCQNCRQFNATDRLTDDPQPTIATKTKKSLLANLGTTALIQMCLLALFSLILIAASVAVAIPIGIVSEKQNQICKQWGDASELTDMCHRTKADRFTSLTGGFGGFNSSLTLASMSPDSLGNEFLSFCISNGAQFAFSLIYFLLIYNLTLISQELDWGKLEHGRKRIRCTIVEGPGFTQDYLLQLPKKILIPTMLYSIITHWMLGEALQTQEVIWLENSPGRHIEHSKYMITYAAYPIWIATFLVLLMTAVCWWAFTFKRGGFIPQMYGSIRTLCSATAQLDDFPAEGIQWGGLGEGLNFLHAGLSADGVEKIRPNELYE